MLGINASLVMLQKLPEWVQMGSTGQDSHTFVELLQEVATELTAGEPIDWIGCPTVPEKVLEAMKIGMLKLYSIWIPQTPTEIMTAIHKITDIASTVHGVLEKLNGKQEFTEIELGDVLDGYGDVSDEILVTLTMPWDKVREAQTNITCTI